MAQAFADAAVAAGGAAYVHPSERAKTAAASIFPGPPSLAAKTESGGLAVASLAVGAQQVS